MSRLTKLQLIGPLVLGCTIIAAELATYLLAWMPSSEFAWYLNLEVFGVFQRSHYMLSNHFVVPYFQLLFVAAPIMLLTCSGFAFRLRFPIAAASNLELRLCVLPGLHMAKGRSAPRTGRISYRRGVRLIVQFVGLGSDVWTAGLHPGRAPHDVTAFFYSVACVVSSLRPRGLRMCTFIPRRPLAPLQCPSALRSLLSRCG